MFFKRGLTNKCICSLSVPCMECLYCKVTGVKLPLMLPLGWFNFGSYKQVGGGRGSPNTALCSRLDLKQWLNKQLKNMCLVYGIVHLFVLDSEIIDLTYLELRAVSWNLYYHYDYHYTTCINLCALNFDSEIVYIVLALSHCIIFTLKIFMLL